MSAVDLLEAFNQVRQEVHLCPEDLIRQAIRDTLNDFCRVTRAYQHEVDNESIMALVSDYDTEVPNTGAAPIAIEAMTLDGAPVIFKSKDWLDDNIWNWRLRSADDFSYFTHVLGPQVITFPCVPTKNGTVGGLQYRVSLRPTDDATEIESVFADEWKSDIEAGAKANLLLMVNKSWTNVARGGDLERRYIHARGQARIRANRSFGNSQDVWRGPRFA